MTTARARDAGCATHFTVHADGWITNNMTGEPRTRTHAINPTTGEFTRLDQESDTMTDHRAAADKALDGDTGWGPLAHLMAAVHDTLKVLAGNSAEQHATLTEIRDRLPERVEVKVAPFDPDVIAANLEAIKHEAERDEQTRDAIEWRNRYDALRTDVEKICADAKGHAKLVKGPSAHEHCAQRAHGQLVQVLTRDDERAES